MGNMLDLSDSLPVGWLLVPGIVIPAFQKPPLSWAFHGVFKKKKQKKKNIHQVAVLWAKTVSMIEATGEWADSFKPTERLHVLR